MIERPARREATSPALFQLLKVMGHGGGGDADRLGQHAGGQAVRPSDHERPHQAQAVFLGEGRERGRGLAARPFSLQSSNYCLNVQESRSLDKPAQPFADGLPNLSLTDFVVPTRESMQAAAPFTHAPGS